jgi:hypothetical protein
MTVRGTVQRIEGTQVLPAGSNQARVERQAGTLTVSLLVVATRGKQRRMSGDTGIEGILTDI